MTPSSTWPAPAKVNLFLHVTGRRADGYHTLQTAFQFLDCCDYLAFEVRDDGQVVRRNELPGVPADKDICLRAARLLQCDAGVTAGVAITLDKRLPMGGGLGGGSSDAATTLWALNVLWDLDYDIDRLAALGLQLGADVPVFVRGFTAWAEGVGEQLQMLDWPRLWYLVIAPPVHVSTAELFQAPDLTRQCPPITIRDLAAGQAGNVFEPVVRRLYPEVATALDWLSPYTTARMTGTGACVFGCFDGEREARDMLARFHDAFPPDWQAFVARGLNQSPLMETISRKQLGRRR